MGSAKERLGDGSTALRVDRALRRGVFVGAWIAILLALAPAAQAGSHFSIETLIPYAETSEVLESIRQDCGLGTRLSRRLIDKGQKLEVTISRVGDLSAVERGSTLAIRITDAIGTSGGLLPSKSVSIDGVLKEKNKVVGTFVATRFARASLIPFERDDCSIYSHAIDRLAKDVAKWLANPGMDSRLGDAR
jgi:hypothetical protein